MADVHDKKTRSYNMSQIKGKDTKPEILIRKFLFSKGFRYRLYDKKLPGKPDIVLPKYKTVIFIHGCFWHGHENCRYFVVPKTRTDWWLSKINRNQQNDVDNLSRLKNEGWDVLTIFECELKDEKLNETMKNILVQLKNKLSENKDE
ncbi:MAG TPA: DNA mismatch endonuclease Vsr [Bacteroidales bacterium]|nr:DNA mismatch endonuclease Vsr [Bacteroidales bacterium]